MVIVNDRGDVVDGRRKPSSETPLHTMVMRARPDIRAIVHTHSHYATVVSCIRPYLPPILTEVCLVVGARVPVTRYGLTGTPDFGESVLEALEPDSRAVILKNHGLVCFAESFDAALGIAEIVEERPASTSTRCGQWWTGTGSGPGGVDSGDDRAVPAHLWTTEIAAAETRIAPALAEDGLLPTLGHAHRLPGIPTAASRRWR